MTTHQLKKLAWKRWVKWGEFNRYIVDLEKIKCYMEFQLQVEAIHSYNAMKDNLMEYLAKFANSKKVVREEDIKEFFEGMKKNKMMKAGGPPPSSCK